MQSTVDYLWLCLSAAAAGGINALAGGGTLLTFPTLISVIANSRPAATLAMAQVLANGTSTVALVPASLGSAWGFRRETYAVRHLLIWLLAPSIVGGVIGALLLVSFPKQFSALVPWLLLVAAVLFTLQPYVARRVAKAKLSTASDVSGDGASISPRSLAGMMLLQLFISIYGGYFGAGIGILMLSCLGLMGLSNMHQMNGIKAVLGTTINGVAAVVFIATQKVVWEYALAMMATSLLGGYFAAHYSRQIDSRYVRWLVIVIGFGLAALYFVKAYH
ncbi:MAG: sulfite exporter TauE/SafE family protein [Planctomycetia bacterium]|jgi:uncharacterized membrane protein YfcA|nr:sulfite exporter TauE/SafE family protein [Planctomycetia bacterium]